MFVEASSRTCSFLDRSLTVKRSGTFVSFSAVQGVGWFD